MSAYNILVDDVTKAPVAVLDWEQIYTVPDCLAEFYPPLLRGYGHDRQNDAAEEPDCDFDEDAADNYEKRLLREAFRARLGQLDTAWDDVYAGRKREFLPRPRETLDGYKTPQSATDELSVGDGQAQALDPEVVTKGRVDPSSPQGAVQAETTVRKIVKVLWAPLDRAMGHLEDEIEDWQDLTLGRDSRQ